MLAQFNIHELSRRIKSGENSVEELSSHLPCYMHINSTHDFSLLETDQTIERYFQRSKAEINAGGFELLQQVVLADDLAVASKQTTDYLLNAEFQNNVSFFQRIRFPEQDELFFFTRGKLLDNDRIFNLSIPLENASLFNHKVLDIYERASFIQRNIEKFNRLTQREILVSKALCNGDNIQNIADHLKISKHTIKNHKVNIYRKLEVRNYFEFYYFATSFKLNK